MLNDMKHPSTRSEALMVGATKYLPKYPCKNGHRGLRYVSSGCVRCVRERVSEYRKLHHDDHLKNRRTRRVAFRRETPEYHLWKSVRRRAKTSGLPFNLDISDIVIPTHCPVLRIPLFQATKGRTKNSPSVDQIKPGKGYVKQNIIVISYRANFLKSNASLKEIQLMAKFYRRYL